VNHLSLVPDLGRASSNPSLEFKQQEEWQSVVGSNTKIAFKKTAILDPQEPIFATFCRRSLFRLEAEFCLPTSVVRQVHLTKLPG